MIETTLASNNHLPFRGNLLERMQKLIMASDVKIIDKKLQYDINRKTTKILALP